MKRQVMIEIGTFFEIATLLGMLLGVIIGISFVKAFQEPQPGSLKGMLFLMFANSHEENTEKYKRYMAEFHLRQHLLDEEWKIKEKIPKLKRAQRNLEEKVRAKRQLFSYFQNEILKLERQKQDVIATISSLKEKKSRLESYFSQPETLKKELQKAGEKLKIANALNQDLKKILKTTNKELKESKTKDNELKVIQSKHDTLVEKNKKLQAKLDKKTKQRVTDLKNKCKDQNAQIKQSKQHIGTLEQVFAQYRSKSQLTMENLEKELVSKNYLQLAMENLKKQSAEKTEKLTLKLEKTEAELLETKQNAESISKECAKEQANLIQEMVCQQNRFQKDLDEMQQKNAVLREENSNLTVRVESLIQEMVCQQNRFETDLGEMQHNNAVREENNNLIQEMLCQQNRFGKDLNEMQQKNAVLREENNILTVRGESLIQEMVCQQNLFEKDLEEMQHSNAILREENHNLTVREESLIHEMVCKQNLFEKDLEEMQHSNAVLREENNNLTSNYFARSSLY